MSWHAKIGEDEPSVRQRGADGTLYAAEVLTAIFEFVEIEISSLMTLSHVSHRWRFYSKGLPHWQLVAKPGRVLVAERSDFLRSVHTALPPPSPGQWHDCCLTPCKAVLDCTLCWPVYYAGVFSGTGKLTMPVRCGFCLAFCFMLPLISHLLFATEAARHVDDKEGCSSSSACAAALFCTPCYLCYGYRKDKLGAICVKRYYNAKEWQPNKYAAIMA